MGALFRIAEHTMQPGQGASHGDLFILMPEAESLITYNIQGLDLLTLLDTFENRADLEAILGQGSILITRKANHRMLYWTFSGEISGDRGRVREVCSGRLIELPLAWPDTTALKINDVLPGP